MKKTAIILVWARGGSLALALAVMQCASFAQGIIYVTPQQPITYGPGEGSYDLDINGNGITDYVLFFTPSGAYFTPQGGNSIAVDGSYLVAALNEGQNISSSLDPAYQWYGSTATLGAQAIFDGQYVYTGNFSDTNAFVGLQFQSNGETHYGWMEIHNYPNVAAGQVLDWAYESSPNTPIAAGTVPEPSFFALSSMSALAFWLACRRGERS